MFDLELENKKKL